ncbi:MAG: hypothetical protein M1831_002463 [Alyxoria varia]|nr:MAG: hypothetical protein M1831_002463 [Alyxoria varia]
MSLKFTAAQSSRVTKSSSKSPLSRRSTSSPLSKQVRKSNSSSRSSKTHGVENAYGQDSRLEDHGIVTSLTSRGDVLSIIKSITDEMFDEVPERASGMNSTRTAEVLNFRRNIPPIVSLAHVHALSSAPTAAEREIAALVQSGEIRKLTVPGRGSGKGAIGECLVQTVKWVEAVEASVGLDDELKVSGEHFEPQEIQDLIQAGFLTNTSSLSQPSSSSLQSATSGTLSSLSAAGSRGVSGSPAAVGGNNAVQEAGGGGFRTSSIGSNRGQSHSSYTFSLPSTGVFLRLLSTARSHLTSLLSRSQFREATMDLLRERWDGGIATSTASGKSYSHRNSAVVLPGRTKKWKQFYGLKFQWVLEECLGSGLIECFETGSVGLGVRLTS